MWYDVFVVAVLIVSMVRGAMRGVIWQLAGIVGLVLCLVFAETISATVGPHVALAEPLNHWVVMFGSYLFFSFLSFGFARMIHGWLEQAKMTEFDRHLGSVFGLLKGIAFCLVLTFFIVTLSDDARAMLKTSKSGMAAAIIMDRLHPIMPEKIRNSLDKYIHQLDTPDLPLKHNHDHEIADGHDGEIDIFGDPIQPTSGQSAEPSSPWGDLWGQSTPTTPTTNAPALDPIDEIISRLPSFNQATARTVVEQAMQNVPPEQKTRMLDELKAAAPGMILTVASQYLKQGSQSSSVQQAVPQDESTLIRDIAAQYSPAPPGQPSVASQVEGTIRGLPDSIALGFLQDWRADLVGDQADPDPQTNKSTSIEQRIIRQLTIQRVPVAQLSDSMQQRLRAARQ
ncbi:MAG: CvpA family protein [Planctomycetaceae bacterium]